MIAGPTRRGCALEAERRQIQLVDEDVDHPDGVLGRHVVVDAVRKQKLLMAIAAFDEAAHLTPPTPPGR